MSTFSSPPHILLGVAPSATRDDIQAAWRRAAARLHPDRNPDPMASTHLAEVNAARAAMLQQLDEAARVDDLSSIFDGLFGELFRHTGTSTGGYQRPRESSSPQSPQVPTIRVCVPLERWLWGGDGSVSGPDGTSWSFHLPPGSVSPARHRVQTNAGTAMDLVLECADQVGYVRRGPKYVVTKINLDVVDAILGGPVVLEPIGTHAVRLDIPPGVQGDTVLRVALSGDVLVDVQVSLVVPTSLSPTRRAALDAYRAAGSASNRSSRAALDAYRANAPQVKSLPSKASRNRSGVKRKKR